MDAVTLRPIEAGDADWLIRRHGALYAQEAGFDETFAQAVSGVIAGFLSGHDPRVERGWIAQAGDRRLGSILCTRCDAESAQLRLFLLEPETRGQGLGRRMLDTCMDFAREAGYRRMLLWTHESHRAACRLYQSAGFACVSSRPVQSYGQDLVEQHWARRL